MEKNSYKFVKGCFYAGYLKGKFCAGTYLGMVPGTGYVFRSPHHFCYDYGYMDGVVLFDDMDNAHIVEVSDYFKKNLGEVDVMNVVESQLA